MTHDVTKAVELAMLEVHNTTETPTLRDYAVAATRAVLTPLPPETDTKTVDAHLDHLEAALGAITCTCGRKPTIGFSHEKECAGKAHAERRKNPEYPGPPVTVAWT